MGYKNVFVFRDGLPGWIAAGYPVESIEKLPKVDTPVISTADLKRMLDEKENFVLLDIRNPIDAGKNWIKSSNRINIDIDDLGDRLADIPKGKKVVVLDLNGKRCNIASAYLYGKGFQDLARVGGGMNQWALDGNPTAFVQ